MKKTVDNRVSGWYNNQRRQGRHTSFGGLAQLVSGSIPLFSTNQEQNEHRTTIQMVGNVFVLFCEIPNVTLT